MTDAAPDIPYRVLARKYRPATFRDLIGQEAMVRILRNAFEADRIAHAFILTGVRGVGKTTTARIIAKGLNCTGPDGQGGPTIAPCGLCDACRAISDGRHVDVLEMDAASRTGVGDIREIIDSVAYRATSARFKVYIIDEVHMLSTSAFNALLKTLEEPPAHVKFLFATTEIRKVPVTVLSRCQRFDLRRIAPEAMLAHLAGLAASEGARVAPDALGLITRAAEGSVRDALSLLDQAIAHGGGETTAEDVRAMLGLADRGRVLDLFEAVMRGDAKVALAEIAGQYASGADPVAVLRDLAEVTHWISMLRLSPENSEDPTVGPDERARGLDFAQRLGMRPLTRMWQMLLKALEEAAGAPNAMMAAEMAIIRLTHVADLPSPEELVRRLTDAPAPATNGASLVPASRGGGPATQLRRVASGRDDAVAPAQAEVALPASPEAAPVARVEAAVAVRAEAARLARAEVAVQARPEMTIVARANAEPVPEAPALSRYAAFEDVVALVRARRDMALLVEIETGVRLVRYAPGRIEFEPAPGAAPDLAARLSQRLKALTGARWGVAVLGSGGAATIAEDRATAKGDLEALALAHPLVQAVLAAFPAARIKDVRPPEAPAAAEGTQAEDDDDWDPLDPFAQES